jgi:thymidylate synthase ThyX
MISIGNYIVRLIKASYEILTDLSDPIKTILKPIETAARTCYKSYDSITDDSCINFCRSIIKRGHEAVIEHSQLSVKFTIDRGISHELVRHRLASYCQESSRYCVSGDTNLKFSNHLCHWTVGELYSNILNSKNGSWKRLLIRQMDDNGVLVYGYINGIYHTGKKEVFEISTKLGYKLKCTADHLIYTSNGYMPLQDISVGDRIYVNGSLANNELLYKNYDWLYHQYITLNKTYNEISNEFNYNVNTLKKWASKLNIPKKPLSYFNKGRNPWNRGIHECDGETVKAQAEALRKYHHCGRRKDKILKYDTSAYQKRNSGECYICKKSDCILDVHHIDEDHNNNNPQNLITLCRPHHSMIHSKNLDIITLDEVTSIINCGIDDVYDISMKQYSNFIANGIVVHNCNYSKNKFFEEIKVIEPDDLPNDSEAYGIWYNACKYAEVAYMDLIKEGIKPELARNVLPMSVATEIVMTANIREWRSVFKLRTTEYAHPQMRSIMRKLLDELKSKVPILFDDIVYTSV